MFGAFGAATAYADDINFEVMVDRSSVSLGSAIQLSLTFHGVQDISAVDLPKIDGFDARYLGPSTRMSIVNGKTTRSITHLYTLIPLKEGKLYIPSLSIDYRGKTYASEPIKIEVGSQASRQSQSPATTHQGVLEGLDDKVFLIMQTGKKKAYINEIIPVTIKIYINKLAIRDIQYPQFDHQGFVVDKFAEPKQYQEVLGGVSYYVIEFKTNIFGIQAGELKLGPAQVNCNLVAQKNASRRRASSNDFFRDNIFDDFFGRYTSHPIQLKSIDIPINILPLPEAGKPESFNGTVGNYRFYLEAEPRDVKVGDPITLKMNIRGDGNLKTVNSPTLNLGDSFKIYEPEVKQDKSSKSFEQVIIPTKDTITSIPKISFSFFDTVSGTYKTISKGPISIKVKPLAKGEELKILELPGVAPGSGIREETLGRDIIYIKDNPGNLKRTGKNFYSNGFFIVFLFIPPLMVIATSVFQSRRERLMTDLRYARGLRAPKAAKKNLLEVKQLLSAEDTDKFFDTVFKTLQEYLGDKFHLSSAGITSDVIEQLKSLDVEAGILEDMEGCFNVCDRARYAPSSITQEQMYDTYILLTELIDKLERRKI
ncbi:BatD family protein [Candidatus Omnitrophota bacterium]